MSCNIDLEFLKLARITYGGELYLDLKNYTQKEVILLGSKIEKKTDLILSKKDNNTFFSYKNDDSGFAANVFENKNTGNIVIAYRGTERTDFGENASDYVVWGKDIMTDINLILGNTDEQFSDAFELYKAVKEQNPKAEITLTGHSLGGGLCQIVAAREYCQNNVKLKSYTYNAPGCKQLLETFNCNPDLDYSFIKNYAVMNDWCGMFGDNIGETYLISPIPLNASDKNSPVDIMNNILLTTHEGIFDYNESINGEIIRKPDDFNQQEGLSLWYFDKNNPIKDVDTVPEFINTLLPQFNFSQFDSIGQSIKDATAKFINDNEENIDKIQKVSEKIKNKTEKFIDEQKTKISQIELPKPIKEAAENIIEEHNIRKEKFMETINNSIPSGLTKLFETTLSQVSVKSLQSALKVLTRENNIVNQPLYIAQINEYIKENA